MRYIKGGLLLVILILPALAQDEPPALMWAREYFPGNTAKFTHVDEACNGDYLVAGYRIISGQTRYCALRFSETGDFIWQWEPGYLGQLTYWIEELSDGSVILCGGAIEDSGSEYGILVAKLFPDGEAEWVRIIPAPYGMGLCITPIQDDGFAICGYINDFDPLLMRIDSQGDTLWTRVWETGWARARRVVFHDNGLIMYMDGGLSYGPLLIRYDLDGNLEWVSDFTGEFPRGSEWGGSMCLAPEGGYTFVTDVYSQIAHTDWSGEVVWAHEVFGDMIRYGFSVNPTMDGGYVFSGRGSYWGPPCTVDTHSAPADTGSTWDGWLVKMDSQGNDEWHVFNSLGTRDNYFNCVQQLSQGGYIVAGQIWDTTGAGSWNGYLLRYAPETGIEGDDPVPDMLTLNPSSNPFTSSITITCEGGSLPGQLMIYDITGRLIRSLSDSEGSSFTWDGRDASGAEVSPGTYLIQGAVDGWVSSIRVVRL